MMEAVRTSETSVDNHFTRQYIPEDNSEHHNSISICMWVVNIQSVYIFRALCSFGRTHRWGHAYMKPSHIGSSSSMITPIKFGSASTSEPGHETSRYAAVVTRVIPTLDTALPQRCMESHCHRFVVFHFSDRSSLDTNQMPLERGKL
jgi:hypothetical protein